MTEISDVRHAALRIRDEQWRGWLDRVIPDWEGVVAGYQDDPPPDRK